LRPHCLGRKKINFSTVFAGQAVGIKEVHDDIWLSLVAITTGLPSRYELKSAGVRN
jgi:hypothetical protein